MDAPRIADVIDTGKLFAPDIPLPVEARTRMRGLALTRGFLATVVRTVRVLLLNQVDHFRSDRRGLFHHGEHGSCTNCLSLSHLIGVQSNAVVCGELGFVVAIDSQIQEPNELWSLDGLKVRPALPLAAKMSLTRPPRQKMDTHNQTPRLRVKMCIAA